MTKTKTDLRLDKKIGGFDFDFFLDFVGKKGKDNFGLGDEAKFLQSSSWGREGNEFDVLDQMHGLKRLLRS